jgi:hypothetical protein
MKHIFKMGKFLTMQIFFQLIISNFLSHSIQAWYCKVANDLFCGKRRLASWFLWFWLWFSGEMAYKGNHRLNMELDLQSFFGLHVHSCTHWLRTRNPSLPPHLGSYTRALLVSQDTVDDIFLSLVWWLTCVDALFNIEITSSILL